MISIKITELKIPKKVNDNINIFYGAKEEIINENSLNIGHLKIKGNYPSGSAGSYVGEYLRGISAFVRELDRLILLIIDLKELKYSLGNNLIGIVSPAMFQKKNDTDWLGYYLLVDQENFSPIVSLCNSFGYKNQIKNIFLNEKELNEKIDTILLEYTKK